MHADVPAFDLLGDQPHLHETLRELRGRGPVVPVSSNLGGLAYLVLSHAALRSALRDENAFPAAASYSEIMDPATGRSLLSMSGDEHTRNRAAVTPTFRRSTMTHTRNALLEPIGTRLLDAIAGTHEVDLRATLTHPMPMMVITNLIGMPPHEYVTLERWTNQLFAFAGDPKGALTARQEFSELLMAELSARRAQPRDDLVSRLVHSDVDGQPLTDEEVLSFLRLLFPAGTHNTSNAISSLVHAVLVIPDLQERLRADPARIASAAEEALRWEPPVSTLPRRAGAQSVELAGVHIPANSSVLYSFSAANRDPDVFSQPDAFNIDRPTHAALTFGFGEHFCLGAWLAREEMTLALSMLLDRTRHIELLDPVAASPVGASLRGPRALPVRITWR